MRPQAKPMPASALVSGSWGLSQFSAEFELAQRIGAHDVFDGVTDGPKRRDRMRATLSTHQLKHLYAADFKRVYGEAL